MKLSDSAYKEDIQNVKQRFGIIGNSKKLNYAIQIAVQVAPTDLNVLITGESGSGKESFSKIIHQVSHRKHKNFIALNCGAIPSGTIDSELFGHEKGSFTDATEARKGYFEVTNGGTIFLDEIAEMPLGTQARLLRILENKEFIRVGSSTVQKTDVRVVAATNVNLLEKVANKQFREDLYYRLSTVPIQVPPLRERGDDIIWIFRKFADDFAEKYRITPIELTLEAEKQLLSYRFPGNIRQLKNITEQISALEIKREINLETIKRYIHNLTESRLPVTTISSNSGGDDNRYSDREILYNLLFEMKKDMNDLKRLVLSLLKNPPSKTKDLIEENKQLFKNISDRDDIDYLYTDRDQKEEKTYNKEEKNIQKSQSHQSNKTKVLPLEEYEDITPEATKLLQENYSLEEKEKEMITLALKKHNNRRRSAAVDLGISERTLYRKIKQYNINLLDN